MKKQHKNIDVFLKNNISQNLFDGGFGFEKENVRVDTDGNMATTPHPEVFGAKTKHPYITTDFSESQIEMITPVRDNLDEAVGFLETLHDQVSLNLDNEYLWPQSTPPALPINDDDIPIAKFDSDKKELENYRTYLASIYGKRVQMISGIHFNISFSEKVLKHMYNSVVQNEFTYNEFREQLYLKAVRNYKRYRWIFISLFGCSPAIHKTFNKKCINRLPALDSEMHILENGTSFRNGRCGYKNIKDLILNYDSMQEYRQSIKKCIKSKLIINEKENYATIRIKMQEKADNISHLELRFLDLNPMVKFGVDINHAKIIHQIMIYCLLKEEDTYFNETAQKISNINHQNAANYGMRKNAKLISFDSKRVNLHEAIIYLYKDVIKYTSHILPDSYQEAQNIFHTLVYNQDSRPSAVLLEKTKDTSFYHWHLSQAKQYLKQSKSKQYSFNGLENMELSTQLLLRESVLQGIDFDIMDKNENFLRLKKDNIIHYVQQATKTALDNYSSILLMENKLMTKKLLDSANIKTPIGEEYNKVNKAKEDYLFYKGNAIVIKPKTTNFGIGITILKENNNKDAYDRAVEIAFEKDRSILIEEFISGKEYRFFVINNKVVGILHRVPANVIGDGKLNIKQLVEIKNQDPLRGKGYITPLEKISTSEAELMFLKSQNKDFETIPKEGEIVYLRENSNISTGGDSIDFTDDIDYSYKQIAIDSAKALDVKISGIDIMIDDIKAIANSNNHAIIEMNFNPAIHIHCYPYKGKNRHLDKRLLAALGFY